MTAEKLLTIAVTKDFGGYNTLKEIEKQLMDINPSRARMFYDRAYFEARNAPKSSDGSWGGHAIEKVVKLAAEFGVTVLLED